MGGGEVKFWEEHLEPNVSCQSTIDQSTLYKSYLPKAPFLGESRHFSVAFIEIVTLSFDIQNPFHALTMC